MILKDHPILSILNVLKMLGGSNEEYISTSCMTSGINLIEIGLVVLVGWPSIH